MNADKTVSYRFDSPISKFTLTVDASAGGSVQVLAGGQTVNCPCSVNQGTRIQLVANPFADNDFTSWSGACAGQGQTCNITMNSNASVSATFTHRPPPPPPVITSVHCDYNGNNKFSCDVFHTGGGHIEWSIDKAAAPGFDDQSSITSGCGGRVNHTTGIDVTITNASGSAHGSDSVTCEGQPK